MWDVASWYLHISANVTLLVNIGEGWSISFKLCGLTLLTMKSCNEE